MQFGMAAVMQWFAIVMRKLFAAVGILIITGVLPAMASLHSCAMKPCCAHAKAAAAIDTHSSCCNEPTAGSMATAKPVTLTHRSNVRERPIVTASTMIAPPLITAHDNDHQHLGSRAAKRPPETISILLI